MMRKFKTAVATVPLSGPVREISVRSRTAPAKPMGISTSQVCSPQALLSGRSPTAADCHDETYILGVVCQ